MGDGLPTEKGIPHTYLYDENGNSRFFTIIYYQMLIFYRKQPDKKPQPPIQFAVIEQHFRGNENDLLQIHFMTLTIFRITGHHFLHL